MRNVRAGVDIVLTTGPRLLHPGLPRAAGRGAARPRVPRAGRGVRRARRGAAARSGALRPDRAHGRTRRLGTGWNRPGGSTSRASPWRASGARLGRAATAVALLTSPALFVLLYDRFEWPLGWAIAGTILGVAAFRGLIDVLAHKLIPAPSLYGAESELRDQDVLSRRRLWYWRRRYRQLVWIAALFAVAVADHDGPLGRARRRRLGRRQHRHDRRPVHRAGADAAPVHPDHHGPVLRELPDPVRAAAAARHPADQGLRAGRRGLGRQARRRPRPGRGQAGDHPRRAAVAVGRGVREGRRQARARRAVPRRARHRQDDALQGHRDLVQLPVRVDPGLGLRADVHRHGRGARALPRPQGEEARRQVGRPVHRVHRRDRRRRHAPPVARLRLPARAGLLRPARRAHPGRRHGAGDRRVARVDVPAARRGARARLPGAGREAGRRDQALHDARHGRPGRRARAQPAARGDGRHRRPAGHQALPHPPLEHVPRRALHRPAADLEAAPAPEAAAPAQGGDLLHRGLQRGARAARPRAHPPGPDGPAHLLPDPELGGPARHLRPLPRQGRPRGRSSTSPAGATSWPASPTATRRR